MVLLKTPVDTVHQYMIFNLHVQANLIIHVNSFSGREHTIIEMNIVLCHNIECKICIIDGGGRSAQGNAKHSAAIRNHIPSYQLLHLLRVYLQTPTNITIICLMQRRGRRAAVTNKTTSDSPHEFHYNESFNAHFSRSYSISSIFSR